MIIVLTVALRSFVVERVVVVGESMEPTLDNGDNVLIDKLSARTGSIKRYDIVVFPGRGSSHKEGIRTSGREYTH